MKNQSDILWRESISYKLKKEFSLNKQMYLLCLPAVVFLVLFHYFPMYGVQLAFKKFRAVDGITGSPWVGFKHFVRFFSSYNARTLIMNTLTVSIYQLIIGFPIPIVVALMLHNTTHLGFKKFTQTVIYAPHFISLVVLCGMIALFLSPDVGVFNKIREIFGGESVHYMADPAMFRHIYVLSGVWQSTGWGAIIYLAALSAIDPQLYEAAKIDGASRLKCILYVEIPGIMNTMIILLILRIGTLMNLGFQKAFLLQTPANLATSEFISTYVYKIGLLNAQFSFSTAVDLFNTLINIILLFTANNLSRKYSESSLW